jgi:hypothetical protein
MGLLDMFARKPQDPDAWYNSINPGLLSQMTGMDSSSDPTYGLLNSQNTAYQQNYPAGPQDLTSAVPGRPDIPQVGSPPPDSSGGAPAPDQSAPLPPAQNGPPPPVQPLPSLAPNAPVMQTPAMPTSGPEQLTDQQRKYLAKTYKEAVGNKFMDVLLAPPGQQPSMLDKMAKYNQVVTETLANQQVANQRPLLNEFRDKMIAAGGDQEKMKQLVGTYAPVIGAQAADQMSQTIMRLFPQNEAFGSPFAMKDPKTGQTVQGVMTKRGQAIPTGALVAPDLFDAPDGTIMDRHDPSFKIDAGSPEMQAYKYNLAHGKTPMESFTLVKEAGKADPKTTAPKIFTSGNVLMQQMPDGTIKPLVDPGTGKPLAKAATAQGPVINLSPDAQQMLAQQALSGGPVPSFGMRGGATIADIYNKAATMQPGADLAGAKMDFAANKATISNLQKQQAVVTAFENTASKNLDLANSLSAKVDRTGSPVINRYLLQLKGQYAGDTDTQLLNNAVETAASEYAKVMSGGMGNIAVTDSARQHAREMLSSAMSKGTLSQAVALMKQEMGNRNAGYNDEMAALRAGRVPQQGPPAPGGTQSGGRVVPIVQQSPSTKAFRYSMDGGKTWQPGRPPLQQ